MRTTANNNRRRSSMVTFLQEELALAVSEGPQSVLKLMLRVARSDPVSALHHCCTDLLAFAEDQPSAPWYGDVLRGLVNALEGMDSPLSPSSITTTSGTSNGVRPGVVEQEAVRKALEVIQEILSQPGEMALNRDVFNEHAKEVLSQAIRKQEGILMLELGCILAVDGGWREAMGKGGWIKACIEEAFSSVKDRDKEKEQEQEVDLLARSCTFLHMMCFEEDNAYRVRREGGVRLVHQALKEAYIDPFIVSNGCGILYFLTALELIGSVRHDRSDDNHNNDTTPTSPKVVEAVIHALHYHYSSAGAKLHTRASSSIHTSRPPSSAPVPDKRALSLPPTELVITALGYLRTLTMRKDRLLELMGRCGLSLLVSLTACAAAGGPNDDAAETLMDALEILIRVLSDEDYCMVAFLGSNTEGPRAATLSPVSTNAKAALEDLHVILNHPEMMRGLVLDKEGSEKIQKVTQLTEALLLGRTGKEGDAEEEEEEEEEVYDDAFQQEEVDDEGDVGEEEVVIEEEEAEEEEHCGSNQQQQTLGSPIASPSSAAAGGRRGRTVSQSSSVSSSSSSSAASSTSSYHDEASPPPELGNYLRICFNRLLITTTFQPIAGRRRSFCQKRTPNRVIGVRDFQRLVRQLFNKESQRGGGVEEAGAKGILRCVETRFIGHGMDYRVFVESLLALSRQVEATSSSSKKKDCCTLKLLNDCLRSYLSPPPCTDSKNQVRLPSSLSSSSTPAEFKSIHKLLAQARSKLESIFLYYSYAPRGQPYQQGKLWKALEGLILGDDDDEGHDNKNSSYYNAINNKQNSSVLSSLACIPSSEKNNEATRKLVLEGEKLARLLKRSNSIMMPMPSPSSASSSQHLIASRRLTIEQLLHFCRDFCLSPGLISRSLVMKALKAMATTATDNNLSLPSSLRGGEANAADGRRRRVGSVLNSSSSSISSYSSHWSHRHGHRRTSSSLSSILTVDEDDSNADKAAAAAAREGGDQQKRRHIEEDREEEEEEVYLTFGQFGEWLALVALECDCFRRRSAYDDHRGIASRKAYKNAFEGKEEERSEAVLRVQGFVQWMDTSMSADKIYDWGMKHQKEIERMMSRERN